MITLGMTALRLLLLCSVLTGLIYPLLMTGIAQLCCPWRANGSMLTYHHQAIGSQWIGQHFSEAGYFWSRPSATHPVAYHTLPAQGSNAAIAQPVYAAWLRDKITQDMHPPIPADFVMASGSGIDPDISPANAMYQAERVATARHLPLAQITGLIQSQIRGRAWGILGEPTINVLLLNRALEGS